MMFTNVFVPQWAYSEFLKSGKWPNKTVFVVEERGSETKGSINKVGHFQTDRMGYGVEVKDEGRFPEKWAYFNFDEDTKSAEANPKSRLLAVPRGPCRRRTFFRAVLSDTEAGGKEVRHVQRSGGESHELGSIQPY